ncbi:citrulline utilization hydrolase CtlX [Catalinimonas alkaloidigena]|uniref:citrulline utilization hydrolase CtlX n=1 Tax=Catalinimonas alkaloidigena TaxID=1075417 RepID=UPI001FE1C8B8|nr:arginine deiminase-related protein [Catalinimonas alkaloidigena]
MQTTSHILVVRPTCFGFNEETAASNLFQNGQAPEQAEFIRQQALKEFDQMVEILRGKGVKVTVVEDTPEPRKPDALFPNNWISFHADGTICLFPMLARNRRAERRREVIDQVIAEGDYNVVDIVDFTAWEEQEKFLEGTGSMVLDRVNRVAYACFAPRTHEEVLADFSRRTRYDVIGFHATDLRDQPIYHANVMMAIGEGFATVCLQSIRDAAERAMVYKSLSRTHEVIEITLEQVYQFAGNMIQLQSEAGDKLIVLSRSAYEGLPADQRQRLSRHGELVPIPLPTIQHYGGGSARCMIAEIYLPKKG